jgi:hypothetical protein
MELGRGLKGRNATTTLFAAITMRIAILGRDEVIDVYNVSPRKLLEDAR